jgi:hypothetical protein
MIVLVSKQGARTARCRPGTFGVVVTMLFSLAGCDGFLAPPGVDMSVTTDRTDYVAAPLDVNSRVPLYEIEIDVRLQNRGVRPVILETCGTTESHLIVSVEMLSGPEPRRSAFDPIYGCPASAGAQIGGRETRLLKVVLQAPNAVSNGEPFGSFEGTMRLVYTTESGRRVPSNTFSVSLQPE